MNLRRARSRGTESPLHPCLPVLAGLLLAPFGAVAAGAPESPLVEMQAGPLAAPVPDEANSRLLVLGQQVIALGSGSTWVLDGESEQWSRNTWRPSGEVIAVAGDGRRGFLLSGTGSAQLLERIEQVSLTGELISTRSVPLPSVRLSAARGAVVGTTLYVGGTDADGRLQLFSIDVAASPASWVGHRAVAGGGAMTSIVAQNSGIFVTVRDPAGRGDRVLLLRPDKDWTELDPMPGTVVPGAARQLGQAHALYLVISHQHEMEQPRLVMYHAITGSGAVVGEPPAAGARWGSAWGNGLVWARPAGDGNSALGFARLHSRSLALGAPDWIVIVVYLAGMTGIGLYFYLREKRASTSDFFVGSRTIPFWAAGVSLYATNTSSISYIAIPAKAFETNWQYLTNNLVAVLGLVFVAIWIVPLLRRLDLMSVFQYLENRFHPRIRMLASALCILVQIGSRLSVILFLPSLAVATVTGIDVVWCIFIMGAITIAYTALGGMKAVIWTDFVQLFVMFGGALFAIGYIIARLDGGVGEFLAASVPQGKMKLLDFSWDLTQATVWGFVFLVLFDVVLTFPKDQVLMQRVLSTRSAREAGRSVWTFAAIMIPGGFLFYFIGTALYVFYQKHPERMDPALSIDATFPLFIAAELPLGIVGLIIAGILAASMSTLSSIMNSVATLASVDFFEKLVRNPSPRTSVRFAEAMTVITGLVGIGAAYLLSRYDIHSLFDVSIELAGLLGGGFAGAYTLGMFTRRANWQGVSIGIASAIVLTTLAWSMDLVHPYFYLAISIMLCIVIGYLASHFFPAPSGAALHGLTILRDRADTPAVAVGE